MEDMNMKIYLCKHCGNIVEVIRDKGVPVICCGEPMSELIPGTSDGAADKHVPVYNKEGKLVQVTVGSTEHPMADVHYIEWIALETSKGLYRRILQPGNPPKADFILDDDEELLSVCAYCNLHGLWKA